MSGVPDPTPIRVLALDIDGTLACRGDEVSSATRSALHRAHGQGLEVVIATGRRFRTTARVVENLGLPVATVSLGGALVREADGSRLHCRALSPEEFADVAALYRASGQTAVGQRDGHHDDGPDFVIDGALPWNGPTGRYAERNREHCEWRRDLASERRSDVIELCGFGPVGDLLAVADRVRARYPGRFEIQLLDLPPESSSGGGAFLEVRPAGTCKWTGLEVVLARRGFRPEEVCAVGDERNDVSMVTRAGLGVAMANGHPELLAVADRVAGRHDEDGLVELVEQLLAVR